MKYSLGSVAKALMSAVVAFIGVATASAGGVDLATLDLAGWLSAAGAGLTAFGAVFATPNKSNTSVVDQVVEGIPVVIQQAQQGLDDLERVRESASNVLSNIPVFGPAAQQLINSIPRF